jgi:hypothetical protein
MIGEIKERPVSNSKPPAPPTPVRATGFPRAEHRSRKKSSFLKHREELDRESGARDVQLPTPSYSPLDALRSSPPRAPPSEDASIEGKMYDGITEQNTKIVESMTEEEREQGRQEIVERFGLDIGERLRRVRATQHRAAAGAENFIRR